MEHVEVRTCFDPVSFKLTTVGSGKLSVDYWENVGVKFSMVWKLELDIWLLYDLLNSFWILVISTENYRAFMRNMLYYLVHLVGRLLRVRRVRDSCVTVFTFGVYIEIKGIILPGDISYGPQAMQHSSLHVTLYNILLVLYSGIFYSVAASTPRVPSP